MSDKWNIDYDSGFNSGMEWMERRIEKVLPDIIKLGNVDYFYDIEEEMPELLLEAKKLIKGEQK